MLLLLSCAAAIALIAAAAVLRRALSLRARHRAFLAAPVPALSAGANLLIDSPRALYHGTRFADGAPLLAPAWGEACVGDLMCTGEAIFFQREAGGAQLVLPLAWIEEAALVRAHAALASKELPMLRLRWRRGGAEVVTEVSLRGGMASLEALRREVHLRQGQGRIREELRPLLDKVPP